MGLLRTWLALGLFAIAQPAGEKPQPLHGIVYDDANRSQTRDPREAGLPGIVVSDQFGVATTGSNGAWQLDAAPLVARAADDLLLAYIAAGPLENILQAHGARIIDLVTECAQSDARMRRALTGVWGFDRLPREVSRRLEALIEGEPCL